MIADEDRPPADLGVAGASTSREHERRKRAREHKILMHHPFASKDEVTAREGPAHERAFAVGSDGERWVARVLAKRLDASAIALHDRAIPGRRGNIDHIVVARSGVWIIDTKRYSGRLEIWQPDSARRMLTIAKRDKICFIDSLARQVAIVEEVVTELGVQAPVHGALCFVDTDLPSGRLTFEGWHVLNAEQLAKRINITTRRLAPAVVPAVADHLARHFTSA